MKYIIGFSLVLLLLTACTASIVKDYDRCKDTLGKCAHTLDTTQQDLKTCTIEKTACEQNIESCRLDLKTEKGKMERWRRQQETLYKKRVQEVGILQAGIERMTRERETKAMTDPNGTVYTVLFSRGSAVVTSPGKDTLKKVVDRYRGTKDKCLIVVGKACTLPIATQRYPSNLELASHRAANCVSKLIELGAPGATLFIGSVGDRYSSAVDEGERQKERSVVFYLLDENWMER